MEGFWLIVGLCGGEDEMETRHYFCNCFTPQAKPLVECGPARCESCESVLNPGATGGREQSAYGGAGSLQMAPALMLLLPEPR